MVSSTNRDKPVPGFVGISLVNMLNRVGDRADPWGTPAHVLLMLEYWSSILTEKVLYEWDMIGLDDFDLVDW